MFKNRIIKNENFITIQGWMVNRLNLKNNNLLVFAIIYGFTQKDDTWFTGSDQYLSEWCNSSISGVRKNLSALLSKDLIIKRQVSHNGYLVNQYKCNNALLKDLSQKNK